MKRIGGILAPVTTPFDILDGDLDIGALRANISAHLKAGLNGIVLTGSTGEAALLSDAEREAMIDAARSIVPDERWLVVGVGSESPRQTVQRAKAAAVRGADAVLVVAPHYYGGAMMTEAALRAHYTRVADESPVPVLLYNIPKYMHFALPGEMVGTLSRHGNIAGIKDSSGDMHMLRGFLQSQSDSFSVLTGNGVTWNQALVAGVRGGILAVALFAPEMSLDVLARHSAGDDTGRDATQATLTPPAREIVGVMGIAAVKAALDLRGMAGGEPRPPLLPLDAGGRERVAFLLRGAGIAVEAASLA